MTLYEFLVPVLLAVPVVVGVVLLRRETRSLDERGQTHPAE